MRRTLLALLAIALPGALLVACGDDDGGSEADQEHVDAWVVNLTEDEDGLAVPDDEAECMARALVDGIGTEPFEDADVTPEDIADGSSPGELLGDDAIPEDDARAVLAEWRDCTDLARLLAESSGEGLGLDAEGVDCLAEALADEDIAVDLLVTSFTTESGEPDQGSIGRFTVLADECSAGADGGGALVDSVAESLRADGEIDEAQSQCLAQAIIDTIGRDRLVEMSLESGDFESAPPEFQEEMARAILDAADDCGVPLSAIGG